MSVDHPFSFPSKDFEQTAADIIASPRRPKLSCSGGSSYESLFLISEHQQSYYHRCFRHLLKVTQNISVPIDIRRCSVNGGDAAVVEFFRKSGLDNDALSKIWSLSDVNEDGWLDVNEFFMAMHLVVLRVKGDVPIPSSIPTHLRPPHSLSRPISQMEPSPPAPRTTPGVMPSPPSVPSVPPCSLPISYAASNSAWGVNSAFAQPQSSKPSGPITSLEEAWVRSNTKQSSGYLSGGSDNHFYSTTPEPKIHPPQFSDVPPLLVDNRPTAVKATAALMNLKSPTGPPPIPPPRPVQRGHARSASLDLKNVANSNFVQERHYSEASAMANPASVENPWTKIRPSGSYPTVPPPIPARLSPPTVARNPSPLVSRQMASVSTQTTEVVYTKKEMDDIVASIGSELDNLLCCEAEASDGKGVDRWVLRCNALRKQNSELEIERARLAQVRIQLELRLQEFEDKLSARSMTTKPTSL